MVIGHCVSIICSTGQMLRSFVTPESGYRPFNRPRYVAIDGEGNILVTDYICIQKFTPEGKFLTSVSTKDNGPLQFFNPHGITYNRTNNKVYV